MTEGNYKETNKDMDVEEKHMPRPVAYQRDGNIARIVMDDGGANVKSVRMLAALHEAFDRAEDAGALVVLEGRPGCFSGGFDLTVFQSGDAEEIHRMMKMGAELAERILGFPTPVVVACTGHAFPAGAFLMLAADLRIGAEGPYQIGLNEVAIGLTVPLFAVEIARQRLSPAYFSRALTTGEMFDPPEATKAGFLDRTVPRQELSSAVDTAANALTKIDFNAHRKTKERVRGKALKALRQAIETELTVENLVALLRSRP